jgi:hypothetical protein
VPSSVHCVNDLHDFIRNDMPTPEKRNTALQVKVVLTRHDTTTLICAEGPPEAIKLLTRDSVQNHLSCYQLG